MFRESKSNCDHSPDSYLEMWRTTRRRLLQNLQKINVDVFGMGSKTAWLDASQYRGSLVYFFIDNVCSQDKKNVDEYKARIKAQLSRAGLIRGQPRHATQAHSQRGLPRPVTTRSASTRNGSTRRDFDSFHNTVDIPFAQNHGHIMASMTSQWSFYSDVNCFVNSLLS